MKVVLMGMEYWCFTMVSVCQSMSGRLKSPASQMVDVLNFALISLMSSHRVLQSSRSRSGGLYAHDTIRGGVF